MGNRLTRIYTRTGDDGTTGLGDGSRVPKGALRIAAIGELDEANSAVGIALAAMPSQPVAEVLTAVQHLLFDAGGELSLPGRNLLDADAVTALEEALDRLNAGLPPLANFILPGGHPAAAACHLARAICRRAERGLSRLAATEPVNPVTLALVNRISDLLFVAARAQNAAVGVEEPLWVPAPQRARPGTE